MLNYQQVGLIYAAAGVLGCVVLLGEGLLKKSLHLDKLPFSKAMVWVLRILIGLLFLYSGFVKANDFIGFSYKLEEYFEVFAGDTQSMPWLSSFFHSLKGFALPKAWFLSVLEIALGIAIIVGWRMRFTTFLMMAMMLFFTFLTWYSWTYNKVTDCGCFGDALKLTPTESFTKDLILTLMLIPVLLTSGSILSLFHPKKWAFAATLGSFVLAGIFSLLCYFYLPYVDYRPYKVGVDLHKCTTEFDSNGVIKCKDWEEIMQVGDSIQALKGNTLCIITYYIDKAPDAPLRQGEALYQKLKGKVQVLGMTGSVPSTVEATQKQLGISYPISYRDPTMLKTIIRSNPGYMLLKNGVVLKKWHYNRIPSEEEIMALLK